MNRTDPAMPMQKCRVNDIELAYRIDGAAAGAPWLVLSHSLACDHSMWNAQIDAFGDFRLLRFDTRGHGASSAPAGEYTMEVLAGDAEFRRKVAYARLHYLNETAMLELGG